MPERSTALSAPSVGPSDSCRTCCAAEIFCPVSDTDSCSAAKSICAIASSARWMHTARRPRSPGSMPPYGRLSRQGHVQCLRACQVRRPCVVLLRPANWECYGPALALLRSKVLSYEPCGGINFLCAARRHFLFEVYAYFCSPAAPTIWREYPAGTERPRERTRDEPHRRVHRAQVR